MGFFASTDVLTAPITTMSVIAYVRPVDNLDRRFMFFSPSDGFVLEPDAVPICAFRPGFIM